MKTKGILTIIMALTLTLGVVGCGKDDRGSSTSQKTTVEENSNSKKDSEVITQEEKDVFELGSKQTKAIKQVVEKYGVKTKYKSESNSDAHVEITKDENECIEPDAKGYSIYTWTPMEPNDDGSNKYEITYDHYINKKGEVKYSYYISIKYPDTQKFKLDDFKMLKDLMKAQFGDDFDLAEEDKWIQGRIKAVDDGTSNSVYSNRVKGDYRETIQGGTKISARDGFHTFKYGINFK